MQLTNRTLVLFALFSAALAGVALWLEYGQRTTVAEVTEAPPPAPLIPDVRRSGGRQIELGGPLRVAISRGRAMSAVLDCDGLFRAQRPVRSGGVVFPTIPLGQCSITLDGADIPYEPVFPGDRLSCSVDESTTVCTGGMAASYAASVSIAADEPGTVHIDSVSHGPLPVENAEVRVGRRLVMVEFDSGTSAIWTLTVAPDERIEMHFPTHPSGMSGAAAGLRGTQQGPRPNMAGSPAGLP